tara:strand:+ start:2860 stop:6267 length:3408 start_codon:yes stop_codon:yes gene_type:complete
MAVNRFMKPAEQPLLNTYVPLPFKEMSLAYATKQKEHTEAEELAESLDDEILKIKASSPEHAHYLTQYRQGLTTELSDLYDEHEGRYADMVPVLKKIKNRTDLELLQGNLGVIKSSTKQTEKLQKKIATARDSEKYDDDFNPVLGSEGQWQGWFRTGTEGQDDTGWLLSEDSKNIYGTEGARLQSFKYTGLHPHVDELKEANENIFKYVKPDVDKLIREFESGAKITKETKQITLSKLYHAAHKNKKYLSSGFKDELNYVVGTRMEDDEVLAAANNVINNMYGSDEYINGMYGKNPTDDQKAQIAKTLEAKQDQINGLQKDEALTNQAYDLAKTNYIGAMGEKFMMSDVLDGLTWDQSALNKKKNRGRTPQTDWVPVIAGTTPVVSLARPYKVDDPSTDIQNGGQPMQDFNALIVDRKKSYEDALNEYEILKSQGIMDDEMHETKKNDIDRLKYQYQAAAFSQKNLIQNTAEGMKMRRLKNVVQGQPDLIEYYLPNGEKKTVQVGSPSFTNGGYNLIEFDQKTGLPISMNDWDGQKSLTTAHLGYDYSQGFLAYLNNPQGDLNTALQAQVENFGEQGWYGGRSAKLPTWNTTMSKSLDSDVLSAMQSNFTKDDYLFTNNEGQEVSLTMLEEENIIKEEVLDEFIVDSDLPIVWTTVPDPATGNYKGMISIPTDGKDAENTTMTLYFDAPTELKQSWLSLTEDYDDDGLKYTRATTPTEKMVFRNNFNAQMDIQSASTINGDVAPSMYSDGDGRVLGMYYFNQTPEGTPIVNSEFLFRPQAGLVASINPDGSYNYTTGDEFFPTDVEASQLSQLIALNSPTESASLEFWKKHLSDELPTGNNPIAVQNTPVPETSEAREIDVTGMPYSTKLFEGQTSYSGDRIQKSHLYGTLNHGLLGTNIKFANQVALAEFNYETQGNGVIDGLATDFETTHKDVPVTLSDGSQSTILAALTNGDLQLQWVTNSGGWGSNASLPINNSNRTYQEQLDKYNAYVEGGKKGDPIANPNVGGFHVMGQAIDLSQTKGDYDLILVAGENIASIGSNRVGNQQLTNTGQGSSSTVKGVRISELKSNGKTLYPNFLVNRLKGVYQELSTDQTKNKLGKGGGSAPIRQFDEEWWHWSAGEFVKETPAVYPSW